MAVEKLISILEIFVLGKGTQTSTIIKLKVNRLPHHLNEKLTFLPSSLCGLVPKAKIARSSLPRLRPVHPSTPLCSPATTATMNMGQSGRKWQKEEEEEEEEEAPTTNDGRTIGKKAQGRKIAPRRQRIKEEEKKEKVAEEGRELRSRLKLYSSTTVLLGYSNYAQQLS